MRGPISSTHVNSVSVAECGNLEYSGAIFVHLTVVLSASPVRLVDTQPSKLVGKAEQFTPVPGELPITNENHQVGVAEVDRQFHRQVDRGSGVRFIRRCEQRGLIHCPVPDL